MHPESLRTTERLKNDDITNCEQRLQAARTAAAPLEQAVTRTADAYTGARRCHEAVSDELATAKRRNRPLLRSALTIAEHDLFAADTVKALALDAATPARRVVFEASTALCGARDNQRNHHLLEQLSIHPETFEYHAERLQALDTWQHWADGQTVATDQLEHATHTLHAHAVNSPQLRALSDTLPVPADIARGAVGPELSIA